MVGIARRKLAHWQGFLDNQGVPFDVKNAVKKTLGVLEEIAFDVRGAPDRAVLGPRIAVERVELEEDAELPSWKYAVVSLRVSGVGAHWRRRLSFENKIIDAVYSKLSPRQATKIVLDFSYV